MNGVRHIKSLSAQDVFHHIWNSFCISFDKHHHRIRHFFPHLHLLLIITQCREPDMYLGEVLQEKFLHFVLNTAPYFPVQGHHTSSPLGKIIRVPTLQTETLKLVNFSCNKWTTVWRLTLFISGSKHNCQSLEFVTF